MAQCTARVEAHRDNRAALAAWGIGDDIDLMDRVAVATVHVQHRREARETATTHEGAAARATVDAQADTAAEAARARAAQAEAEEVARRAHLVNALAEGQARHATEEAHCQREERWTASERMELTPHERCRLANLHRREFWGPSRSSSAGPSGAGGGSGTSGGQ
jgi:hypothetical protein